MSARRKPHTAYRDYGANRRPGAAHTQKSFAQNNGISLSKYFNLKRRGLGPDEIELDGRIVITPEAEAKWRRKMEKVTKARRAEKASKLPLLPAPVDIDPA